MIKYVALQDKKISENSYDETLLGIYDNEKDALDAAHEYNDNMPDKDKEFCEISVGSITEDDLEDKNDWESFKKVDVLWVIED